MREIKPSIYTLEEAQHYIKSNFYFHSKRPRFTWIPNEHTFTIAGGSCKHRVRITISRNHHSSKLFGEYQRYEVLRLTVRDNKYLTKYEIDEEEFEEIKNWMVEVAKEKEIPINIIASYQEMPTRKSEELGLRAIHHLPVQDKVGSISHAIYLLKSWRENL